MSLRFVLGRSGSGKSRYCLDRVRDKLRSDPSGDPIILIVPEQMTFQTEYALISTPDIEGMIRAQVYSFSRLAWRVLQETGGIARRHVDATGIQMALRRILEEQKSKLRIFRQAAEQSGFYQRLEEMLKEFKRYCVTPEMLEEQRQILRETMSGQSMVFMRDKLHDLELIYRELDAFFRRHYVMSEDYLQLLAEHIPKSAELSRAEIWIDGFHDFTPQEQEVLFSLLKTCPSVTVSLTLNRPHDDRLPDEQDLFYTTAHTYRRLKELAQESGVEVESPVLLESSRRHAAGSGLAHLEAQMETRPASPCERAEDIRLAAAVNRRAEVEGMAREIVRLVRDHGYRWRDMTVMVRNMQAYGELIETIFSDYRIPFFIDQKRSMLHHPVIELIRSVLEVVRTDWRYEAVFRCAKTDLFYPVDTDEALQQWREETDLLENYVLAAGIRGRKAWTQSDPWPYRKPVSLEADEEEARRTSDAEREMQTRINRMRDRIAGPIDDFQRAFAGAKTAKEMAQALYQFLEDLDVPQKLEHWRSRAESEGHLVRAREHDQVWQAVINLLEQLVEMMEETPLSQELFRQMVETGLESLQFSLVPPAMDQVLIGSLERSRFSRVKCAFIPGVNDGELPARPAEDGMLSEEERDWLQQQGVALAPGSRRQLLDEQFMIYLALSAPSDRLWLSYSLADEEGGSLVPSVLINRIKDLFPSLEETMLFNDPVKEEEALQLHYVSDPENALSALAGQLRQWMRGYPIAPLWWDVYNWWMDDPERAQQARRVLFSLFYRNRARSLPPAVSRRLYGERIQTSVSRMERYQSCPFSQFLSHGLRLKERLVFRLEAPDIGQLFHAALKMMDDELKKRKQGWKQISKNECSALAEQAVEQLAPRIQHEILFSSSRYAYIKRKLKQIVERTSHILRDHAQISEFEPIGMEIGFGRGEELPPLRFQLPNGCEMEVAGRIDRVDRARGEKGVLLRVIDYKSSATDLDLSEVYFGLSLQMLTYLDVILSFSERWIGEKALPAGVLYFHVQNPLLSKKTELTEEEIEREILKQFKMKGLVLADPDTVRRMDTSLESKHSDIVPVALKKDGGFYGTSSVASDDDFTRLRRYVRSVIQRIGTRITNGEIEIAPYKLNQRVPCTFCPYHAVCQFDQSLEENGYRSLVSQKDDKMLEAIRRADENEEEPEANGRDENDGES